MSVEAVGPMKPKTRVAMDREDWRKERRTGIGGSDAAAIIGLNRYATPYVVWADKTGRLPEKEDSESIRQGRELEGYVAERFAEETGKKVRRSNRIIRNRKYPFALANVDRLIAGEKAGLECKTTNVLNMKRYRNGEYPEEYYCQCVHYMAVTGCKKWYLAVLVLNQCFLTFTIERDEEEIKALMDAEREFWNKYVLPDVAPSVDGRPPTTDAIKQVFSVAEENEIEIDSFLPQIEHLKALKAQIDALECQVELIEQQLKQELGANTVGHCGKFTITWKSQTRHTLDKKLLIKAYPHMDLSAFEKTTQYRVLRIKEAK